MINLFVQINNLGELRQGQMNTDIVTYWFNLLDAGDVY